MVLQRWQTVFLFIAFITMAAFCILPIGCDASGNNLHAWTNIPFLILNIIAALLLFIDIFLYRNLRLQMRWAYVTMVLLAAGTALTFLLVNRQYNADISFSGASFQLVALALTWRARQLMNKDRKLLAAADRIR